MTEKKKLEPVSTSFLRRRDPGLRTELDTLKSDAGLSKTAAFQQTVALTSFQGEPEELNTRYFETMKIVTKSIIKAKNGSPRQTKLQRLMTIATEFFIDRQVGGQSEGN